MAPPQPPSAPAVPPPSRPSIRNLVIVLGDQLDPASAALDGFDPRHDLLWMAEVAGEAKHVWSHKARIAIFLSAMRAFRDSQRAAGRPIDYRALDLPETRPTLAEELHAAIRRHEPRGLVVVEPGEWRVARAIESVAVAHRLPLEVRTDRHFLSTLAFFRDHAAARKQLRMEFFYRELRRATGVLLESGGGPVGGKWNYDAENREGFGADGPGHIPPPRAFTPSATTREVLDLVERRFPDHPGSLAHFDWPVTPADAARALEDFIEHRLGFFGAVQDAMWTNEPYLYHSRLSAALNLKLLDPRAVIGAAERAWRAGAAPLAGTEGFIRQILGWREYVRGIYWQFMPDYIGRNALGAAQPLPSFYWNGETEMNCLRNAIGQTLAHGYAHHIQRLMVTGLFALLLGVDPRALHEWYLAVYVDAVEWVELPNTLGMSQYADGGVMASKPYIASGKYIHRMSNYCAGCRYRPDRATGPDACPFTTLYWDFLGRHAARLRGNPRMVMQVRNYDRLAESDRAAIQREAVALRTRFAADAR